MIGAGSMYLAIDDPLNVEKKKMKLDYSMRNISADELLRNHDEEYSSVDCRLAIFQDDELCMNAMKKLLLKNASVLEEAEFARSNARGMMFYAGIQEEVVDTSNRMVAVEAWFGNRPMIRDEEAEKVKKIEGKEHYYIRTIFDSNRSKFFRDYVPLNWLRKLRKLDMSDTQISSDGVTAVMVASSAVLEYLDLSGCEKIEDKAVYSIANLARSLKFLNLSKCPKIGLFGLLYLAEMKKESLKELKTFVFKSCAQTKRDLKAVFVALNASGFRGEIHSDYNLQDVESLSKNAQQNLLNVQLEQHNRIHNLALEDIHDQCLTKCEYEDQRYQLNLSKQFINNYLFKCITDFLKHNGLKIIKLDLANTYISDFGLSLLSEYTDLAYLNLSGCSNILDKQVGYEKIQPAISKMKNLKHLDISDTKLSGRIIADIPNLRLSCIIASRCPISFFGVRAFANTFASSLKIFSLSGCRFINEKVFQHIFQFQVLEELDLSFCVGLGTLSLTHFQNASLSFCSSIQQIDFSGIPSLDATFGHALRAKIIEISKRAKSINLKILTGNSFDENASGNLSIEAYQVYSSSYSNTTSNRQSENQIQDSGMYKPYSSGNIVRASSLESESAYSNPDLVLSLSKRVESDERKSPTSDKVQNFSSSRKNVELEPTSKKKEQEKKNISFESGPYSLVSDVDLVNRKDSGSMKKSFSEFTLNSRGTIDNPYSLPKEEDFISHSLVHSASASSGDGKHKRNDSSGSDGPS